MKRSSLGIALLVATVLPAAAAANPPWLDPALLAAAKGEGTPVIFSSVNEEEEMPQLASFEAATGIHVEYVRNSDTAIMARIEIEARAGKESWDVVEIQAAESIPKELRLAYEPPEAKNLFPGAIDPERRWIGGYTVYHAPGYNTAKVERASLPRTYADFAKHPEWAGHVAIDFSDRDWLAGLAQYYGEDKAKSLIQSIVASLHPALYKGHLALARAVGSGEYWVSLNNFVNLTLNVKLAGGPIDYWVLDPVVVTYGEAAINAKAPHPNAAKLLLNYLISAEAQTMRTKWGRIPTRPDVATNPPGIVAAFQAKHTERVSLSPAENERWQKAFDALFKD